MPHPRVTIVDRVVIEVSPLHLDIDFAPGGCGHSDPP